jgi:dTDP-4-dehydrorhamnose reductase
VVYSTPKILLLGSTGQAGRALFPSLSFVGDVVAPDRSVVDFSLPMDHQQILNYILKLKPNIIVNAAAYTNVEKAETEIQDAMSVNCNALLLLSEAAISLDALLIHYSTDYVFDGKKQGFYKEDDWADPLSAYGVTKRMGEINASRAKHLILRTSWLYGLEGNNFFKKIIELSDQRDEIKVIADQWGAPCSTGLLADITTVMIDEYQKSSGNFPYGTYHVTTEGETNWFNYATEIIKSLGRRVKITPITTSEFGYKAKRPYNSRLCTRKVKDVFGIEIPNWKNELHEITARFARENGKWFVADDAECVS